MTEFRVSEAAALLGVSDDTVRRWAEHGRLALRKAANGMQVVDGADLVPLMGEAASAERSTRRSRSLARRHATDSSGSSPACSATA